jgi:hypothetical protein
MKSLIASGKMGRRPASVRELTQRCGVAPPISLAQLLGTEGCPPLSFAADIRPFFRYKDIQAMRSWFDLASYQDVKNNAAKIYDVLAHPSAILTMPCDGPWPPEWVAAFKVWMDGGMLP